MTLGGVSYEPTAANYTTGARDKGECLHQQYGFLWHHSSANQFTEERALHLTTLYLGDKY